MLGCNILLCASIIVTNGTVVSLSLLYVNSYDLVTCLNPVIRIIITSKMLKTVRKIQHYTINIYVVACDWVMRSHSPYMLALSYAHNNIHVYPLLEASA